MSAAIALPLIAAVSCLEVAVTFGALHARVTRRREDLLFALSALCLAGLLWAEFSYASTDARQQARLLFWLRMQYVGAFATFAVFLHFAATVAGEPLPRGALVATYGLGLALVALSFSQRFIGLPSALSAEGLDKFAFARAARGPLWPLFSLVLVLAAAAWAKLFRGWLQRDRQAVSQAVSNLAPILVGYGIVIAAGVALVAEMWLFPQVRLPVSLHSVAALMLCVLTGASLGKGALTGELEKRRLAEEVRQREQAIREVSHEVKNPLAGMQTGLSVVLRSSACEGRNRELLLVCANTCRRLIRLLNDRLDMARLRAGRPLECHAAVTPLRPCIDEVVDACSLVATDRTVSVQYELAHDTVEVDADRLAQIVANLVDNALKHSTLGPVCVTVSESQGFLQVTVSDGGPGMCEATLARVLSPFEQAGGSATTSRGAGLGLALVRELVELQGGQFTAVSDPRAGSTFSVRLPVVEPSSTRQEE